MLKQFLSRFLRKEGKTTFQFQPRWKEECVVTGPCGALVLDMTMGVRAVYLPGEMNWKTCAPKWAREYWPVLHAELVDWCAQNSAELCVDDDAKYYVVREI